MVWAICFYPAFAETAVVKVSWSAERGGCRFWALKPEEKKALGRLIRDRRLRLNWTQERLAGASDVNLRTVQRAEGGYGIGSENLASIAAALGMDESDLRTQAATAGPPAPEKRISLKRVTSAV